MKFRFSLLAAFLLLLPLPGQARPVSVILYPAGALVTEEESLRPENGRLVIHMPAEADEGSLELSLSKGTVKGSTITLREGESSSGVAVVREQLDALADETALLEARRENLAQERRSWSLCSPSADESEREKRMQNVASHLEELARKDAGLAASLRDLAARQKCLMQRLEKLGSRNESMLECTIHVADAGTDPVRVRWSYYLNDAGWEPRYLSLIHISEPTRRS